MTPQQKSSLNIWLLVSVISQLSHDAVLLRYSLHAGFIFGWTVLQHLNRLDYLVSLQFLSRPAALDPVSSQWQWDRYFNIHTFSSHLQTKTPKLCHLSCPFISLSGYIPECQQSSTVDYFFYRVTLNSSTSIAESGGIQWPIVLCLLAAWTLVAICCIRGIKTSGKVCQTTIFLPHQPSLVCFALPTELPFLAKCFCDDK